jgi:hypothetical protein
VSSSDARTIYEPSASGWLKRVANSARELRMAWSPRASSCERMPQTEVKAETTELGTPGETALKQ